MTEFNGSTTTTGTTEVNLFDVTTGGPKYFTAHVYMHNLTATETLQVIVYLYDVNTSTYRIMAAPTYTGVQNAPAYYVATMVSQRFKIGVKMNAGTDRAITWYRHEQQA